MLKGNFHVDKTWKVNGGLGLWTWNSKRPTKTHFVAFAIVPWNVFLILWEMITSKKLPRHFCSYVWCCALRERRCVHQTQRVPVSSRLHRGRLSAGGIPWVHKHTGYRCGFVMSICMSTPMQVDIFWHPNPVGIFFKLNVFLASLLFKLEFAEVQLILLQKLLPPLRPRFHFMLKTVFYASHSGEWQGPDLLRGQDMQWASAFYGGPWGRWVCTAHRLPYLLRPARGRRSRARRSQLQQLSQRRRLHQQTYWWVRGLDLGFIPTKKGNSPFSLVWTLVEPNPYFVVHARSVLWEFVSFHEILLLPFKVQWTCFWTWRCFVRTWRVNTERENDFNMFNARRHDQKWHLFAKKNQIFCL